MTTFVCSSSGHRLVGQERRCLAGGRLGRRDVHRAVQAGEDARGVVEVPRPAEGVRTEERHVDRAVTVRIEVIVQAGVAGAYEAGPDAEP